MRASKRFAALYEQAEESGMRLVVVLVSMEKLDAFAGHIGASPAGPDLGKALSKVEACLALPSVRAMTEARAERGVYEVQLDMLYEQVSEVNSKLRAVDETLDRLEDEVVQDASRVSV